MKKGKCKFNLEDAKKGCPIITRDDRQTTNFVLYEDESCNNDAAISVYILGYGDYEYYINGFFESFDGENPCEDDLFMDYDNWVKYTDDINGLYECSNYKDFITYETLLVVKDLSSEETYKGTEPYLAINEKGDAEFFSYIREVKRDMSIEDIEKELGYKIRLKKE